MEIEGESWRERRRVCVRVCERVCVHERDGERDRERERGREDCVSVFTYRDVLVLLSTPSKTVILTTLSKLVPEASVSRTPRSKVW